MCIAHSHNLNNTDSGKWSGTLYLDDDRYPELTIYCDLVEFRGTGRIIGQGKMEGNGWRKSMRFDIDGPIRGNGTGRNSVKLTLKPLKGHNHHLLTGRFDNGGDSLSGTWDYTNRNDSGSTFDLNRGKLDVVLLIVNSFGELELVIRPNMGTLVTRIRVFNFRSILP